MSGAKKKASAPIADLGLRELGKLKRRERIERAARELFETHGLEGTTMRAVAKLARVGIGTLFRHAGDKSDLFLMLLNDDLDALTARSISAINHTGDFIAEVTAFFRSRFAYWFDAPEPALHALLEFHLAKPTVETERYIGRRAQIVGSIADLVRAQQERGTILQDVDADEIARLVMLLYMAEVRTWIRETKLDAESGIERLEQTMRLALLGVLTPHEAQVRTEKPRRKGVRPPARSSR